jgi:hypothetical protein
MEDHHQRSWRQTLTWKVGFRRAQAGRPYRRPWWADARVYGLAYLHGKDVPTEEGEVPPQPQALPDLLEPEAESPEADWESLMRELRDLAGRS